jgi:hypothetical protein
MTLFDETANWVLERVEWVEWDGRQVPGDVRSIEISLNNNSELAENPYWRQSRDVCRPDRLAHRIYVTIIHKTD